MAQTLESARFRRLLSLFSLWPAAVLFVPLLIPLCTGRIFPYDDLPSFHLPLRQIYSSALHEGHSVLWTSALFGGFYVHGEGQVGAFHPAHYVMYRLLPAVTAMNLELISSYVVALAGMWLFLRCRGLVTPACVLGAMSFAFCGFNLLHLIHMNAIAIVAHIPWLLVAIDLLVDSSPARRAIGFAGLALLVGSQLLLGYPQYVWMSALVCVAYILTRMSGPSMLYGAIAVGSGAALGVAIGGAQLLPTIDLLRRSIRATPTVEYQLTFSLHPFNLIQFVLPYLFPDRVYAAPEEMRVHEFGVYDGALSILALIWCAARWRQLTNRSLASFALMISIIGIVLALGRYALVYQLLTYLPVIGSFRAPARYVILLHVGLAVLLAIAFDDLLRLRARELGRAVRVVAAPLCFALAITALALAGVLTPVLGGTAPPSTLMLGLVPIVSAAILLTLAARGSRTALMLIPVMVAVDLGVWGYSYVWRSAPRTVDEIIAMADAPPSFSAGTLVHTASWEDKRNLMLLRGLRLYRPYVGLAPARRLPDDDVTTWRLAGIEWVRDEKAWSAVPAPMPRVRVLFDARETTDPARDVKMFDVSRIALVDRPKRDTASQAAPPLDVEAQGHAVIVGDDPGSLTVDVSVSGRGILATTESWHEGWRAKTGRQSLPSLRLYGDRLGVLLEPGDYRVQLEFKPLSTSLGILASIAGLVMTAAAALLIWRRDIGLSTSTPNNQLPTPKGLSDVRL
jgi:hypothetical protein